MIFKLKIIKDNDPTVKIAFVLGETVSNRKTVFHVTQWKTVGRSYPL